MIWPKCPDCGRDPCECDEPTDEQPEREPDDEEPGYDEEAPLFEQEDIGR